VNIESGKSDKNIV